MSSGFEKLVRIMARLRGPKGCPWDLEQTHETLLEFLREESKEVEQAVHKKDYKNLKEELGDLLLQIVFHSQLAKERGQFDVHDVVDDLCKKIVRRHPHVFGKKKLRTAAEVKAQWGELKRRERGLRAREERRALGRRR